ncbi:MAG: biotin--[acetyl-CoA-carboxylase] ligase [Actinomycetota bacterium]
MEALSTEIIEASIGGKFGKPLRFYDSIDSTNRDALEWASEGAPEGALVTTDHQTAGRGRWGRTWSSDPGHLLQMSLVLRPGLHVTDAGLVTTGVGVACAEAIEETIGIAARLKWPNDVMLNGLKTAGILVESTVTGSTIDAAVAGIGINVNWTRDDMPEDIRDSATSLASEKGAEVPRLDLLVALLERLERWCSDFDPAARTRLIDAATERSEILGHEVTVRFADGGTVQGTALRLLPSGALELDVDGRVGPIHVGEIQRLRRVKEADPT